MSLPIPQVGSSTKLGVQVPGIAVFPNISSKIYDNSTDGNNSSIRNSDFYPFNLPKSTIFGLVNYGGSDIASDINGDHPVGWVSGSRNKTIIEDIVDEFPRRMMDNLLVLKQPSGASIPIAGSYFIKMMDHKPGTIEPLSCVITDENGNIPLTAENINLTSIDGGSF